MRRTKEEIDEIEDSGELYVCPMCDYHGHADEFGGNCPRCGEDFAMYEDYHARNCDT